MNSLDFLHICLGIGFMIISVFFALVAYQAMLTLQKIRDVLDDVKATTSDITSVKDGLKLGALKISQKVLQIFLRR
jgi:uncharacterized protein YoxC